MPSFLSSFISRVFSVYGTKPKIKSSVLPETLQFANDAETANFGPDLESVAEVDIPRLTVDKYGRITNISNVKFVPADVNSSTLSPAGIDKNGNYVQGVMSAEDKAKLDSIAPKANNYVLPEASTETLGGVKIGDNINVNSGTISVSKSNILNALGYTPIKASQLPTTMAGSGSNAKSGLVPTPPRVAGASKYLREDGTWTKPPVGIVGITQGNDNGTINVIGAPDEFGQSTTTSVAIKGLASGAFTDIGQYALGNHTHNYAGSNSSGGPAFTALTVQNTFKSGSAVDLAKASTSSGDSARLRVGDDGNGYMELATASGGNEPIYIRQYSNASYTNIAYSATILGVHGETTFPVSVTAPAFVGDGSRLTSINANSLVGNIDLSRLADSGVTSGTYGPSANVTGTNGTTIKVPQITVDAKGRVTSITNRTYTSVDNNTTYTHPTGAGYNHIPSGGSSGQILRWNSNGVAKWDYETAAVAYSAGGGLQMTDHVISLPQQTQVSPGTYGITGNVTGTDGATIKVPQITVDKFGRVTSISQYTFTAQDKILEYEPATHTVGDKEVANLVTTVQDDDYCYDIDLTTTGVTAGTYGPTANVTGNDGTTITVPQITVDAYGRISSVNNRTYTSKNTTNFLPLSGGTLTGAFNTANNTWNKSGDDASFGDHNIAGKFCIKGLNGDAGIAFYNSSDGAVGTVTVNNAFTFDKTVRAPTIQSTSDIRKKENFKRVENIDLSQIKAYVYNFKDDKDHKHVGLIAQDVQNIIPEAVSTDSDGFLSLDYNAVVAVLVDKINELSQQINVLKCSRG